MNKTLEQDIMTLTEKGGQITICISDIQEIISNLYTQIRRIVRIVQKIQPSGSPIPGSEETLVEWIIREKIKETEALNRKIVFLEGQRTNFAIEAGKVAVEAIEENDSLRAEIKNLKSIIKDTYAVLTTPCKTTQEYNAVIYDKLKNIALEEG